MRRYRRRLFNRMAEIPTMITGPSGSGKELVARAIGLSRIFHLMRNVAALCVPLMTASNL